MSRAARLAKAERRRPSRATWWLDEWPLWPEAYSLEVNAAWHAHAHAVSDRPQSICHHCLSKSGRLTEVHAAYHRRRTARTRRNR